MSHLKRRPSRVVFLTYRRERWATVQRRLRIAGLVLALAAVLGLGHYLDDEANDGEQVTAGWAAEIVAGSKP
jgi:hypothetical protein